jgi:NhaP-type Na+/H+ or K+/H+ antiporter
MLAVILFILLVYGYSLLSERLEGTVLAIPQVFTAAGMIFFQVAPGLVSRDLESPVWLLIAEITYAIVIFNGATRVDLRVLKGRLQLPGRLLVLGLPLSILLGSLAATLVFPELTLWEAGALACILAATDTGLAERIVRSPRVPASIREALNAESCLSDGLVVPLLMVFTSLTKAEEDWLWHPGAPVLDRVQTTGCQPLHRRVCRRHRAAGWLSGCLRRDRGVQ